ncbi:PREDICTED: uncharacterized protein LOC106540955 [Thamnophis sirtalis]|uniref:Uncharacterized protein LOC106540955 n=1 Tax=Thamnophis sirtalis TaxID=35019 RepID=A0A6I9XLN8_9SAUR|nr:PREDICTED: uncharacterized protein LOC106540955 [Thamnophis sirtalis]
MNSRSERPVPLPRTATKVGKPKPKDPASNHLPLYSVYHDNWLLREDEHNNEHYILYKNLNDYKKLQEENIKIKNELEDLRSQYEQLIEEGKNKCFDERRVSFLKAQALQLERQVVLLTEGLNSRTVLMLELNTSLEALNDKVSSFLSTEGTPSKVIIPHPELLQIVEMCQTMRYKLHRHQQISDLSKLALPWTPGGNLVVQPITLLDVCYGKIENLNLRYVSALEGKLSKLWRHLVAMRQNLSFLLAPGQMSSETAHEILPTVVYARLINQVVQCHQAVEECCSDLLTLTLLVPSAPWDVLENSLSQEFTVENVLATLPAFPKGGPQQRAKRAVDAFVKAQNYSRQMSMQQILALQAELNFHRNLYNLQVQYIEAVFDGIKQAYHTFQDNVAMVLCSPLQDVFSSYTKLKTGASEDALRDFLTAFKNNAEQIQYAIETLTPSVSQQREGDEALSKFGKEFFLSLEQSLKVCGEQRDKAANEMGVLQMELDQALEKLRNLREQKMKKSGTNQHFPNYEEISTTSCLNVVSQKSEPHFPSNFPPTRRNTLLKQTSLAEKEATNLLPKQRLGNSDDTVIQQKGKTLHRSKSMKATERAAWQD